MPYTLYHILYRYSGLGDTSVYVVLEAPNDVWKAPLHSLIVRIGFSKP